MLLVEKRIWRLSRLDLRPVLSLRLGINVELRWKKANNLGFGLARKGCLALFIVRTGTSQETPKLGLCLAEITRANFGSDYVRESLHALKVTIIVLMHMSAEICWLCLALELLMTPGCN